MASQYMIPFSGEEEYSDIDHSTLGFNYQDRIDRAKVAYQHVKRWTKSSDDINRDVEVNKARNRRTDHLATHTEVKNLRQKKIQDKQNSRNENANRNAGYHQKYAEIMDDQNQRKNNRNERYDNEQGDNYHGVHDSNHSRHPMYFQPKPVVRYAEATAPPYTKVP